MLRETAFLWTLIPGLSMKSKFDESSSSAGTRDLEVSGGFGQAPTGWRPIIPSRTEFCLSSAWQKPDNSSRSTFMPDPESKIMTVQQARAFRDKLQASGKKLVFTNGCFDILHRGHVT